MPPATKGIFGHLPIACGSIEALADRSTHVASIVVLRTFANELEAHLAATILEANGIPAQVHADTAGGAYPSIALVFPVRLLVRAEDAGTAREILDTPVDAAPDDADGGS